MREKEEGRRSEWENGGRKRDRWKEKEREREKIRDGGGGRVREGWKRRERGKMREKTKREKGERER
jgi:hypothetical protein